MRRSIRHSWFRRVRRLPPARCGFGVSYRRCAGMLALAAYLFGSAGLAAPAAVSIVVQSGDARPARCSCPDADVRSGSCCCTGKVVARTCCTNRLAPAASEPSESSRSGSACCAKHDSNDDAGLRLTSCPCGPTGPDQYLLCGDPRLSTDPIHFQPQPDLSAIATAPNSDRGRLTHEPPTPPPRSIGG